MNKLVKWLQRVFIDGLSGMALGLFATLIVGTILQQIGKFVGGDMGTSLYTIGKLAGCLTGAGIGCGVAYKYKESPLVVVSAAVAGMVGAQATAIIKGTLITDAGVVFAIGEPLGAFIAAYIAIEVGHLISGRTSIDILLTPITSITAGSCIGLLVGPYISNVMLEIGTLITWATEQRPFLMGILVSVIMGMILTLPISSAALGVILGLSGIPAGAATVGCCTNMIGFAVISYHDNKLGGFLAQGLGTSMLQVPNIVRKPIIWLPVIITSAILGPVSTMLFQMTNDSVGAGMGTAGLVGSISTYSTMVGSDGPTITLIKIIVIQFILPGVISLGIAEYMRKRGWIKKGDMKLEV